MHFSTATILAFLSVSSLAAAQYGYIQRRYAEPMDIYARDAYAEDLYARDVYGSHLYARDPYPSRHDARDAYLERLYRRDIVAEAKAMEIANMKQFLDHPDAAHQKAFNAEADKEVALANKYEAEAKAPGTSAARKAQLQQAAKVLNSDDLPPGYTKAQLEAAGFSATTQNPAHKKHH